jgi:hypothetical protein
VAKSDPFKDEGYKQAVVDVLGVIAYGELSGFARMAADAQTAPHLADTAAISRLAAVELEHFGLLEDRLIELGVEPADAMAPFVAAIDNFHQQTAPADWLEALVKVHVGDGIVTDFYGEIAQFLDDETAKLVRQAVESVDTTDYIVQTVRAAIEEDSTVKGRLALWARRLVGEALTQAQRVAVDRVQLGRLIGGESDLTEITKMLARITESHSARVNALGLGGA